MASTDLVRSDVPGPKEPKMLDRTPRRTLKQADRCDQCGAAAWASATFTGVRDDGTLFIDVPLLFCAHHFTQHEARLRETAVEIVDERAFLYAEVASQRAWREPEGESSDRKKRRPNPNFGG